MSTLPLKPKRLAELEEYALRHGQDPAASLDEVVANYLEWERQDRGMLSRQSGACEDVKAGRTRPASEFLDDLRRKHDLSC